MNSEQTGSKADGQGSGARAITRGEEARVRAALPQCPALDWYADGRLRGIAGEHHAACLHPSVRATAARAGIVPGPEGWCWTATPVATVAAGDLFRSHHTGNVRRADALETRGLPRPVWRMVKVGDELNVVWESPEDLADPSQWERLGAEGVEGQDKGAAPEESEPAPSTPSPQPEGRPARLRAALLAVLASGPVRTGADLLPALDAAMGERAGVAVARSNEAMRAAREIGARVDGVEWSLPPIPDGWGWRRVIASRWYLAPLDASDPEREGVASLTVDDGVGGIGGIMWHVKGGVTWRGCESVEEGQAAPLRAARLAGLFAAPRAEAAPVAAPAPKAPAHASDAPCPACARAAALCEERNPLLARLTRDAPDPIDAGRTVATWVYAGPWRLDEETAVEPATAPLGALARILTGEAAPTMADATAALAAFRAEILAVALARTIDHAAAKREDSEAGAADPLHRAALAVSAARQRLGAADPGSGEWSAAEIDVARVTGALLDAVGVEVPAATNPLRAGLDAADRATLDAVGRLREALAALCAGPGGWRWAVDESAPDAAVRLLGEMVARLDAMRGETWKDAMLRANKAERDAQAERDLTAYHRKRGDEALAELTRVREGIAAVMGAIAGGREVGK